MNNPGLIKTFVAGAAVAAYRIVKFGASDSAVLQAAASTDAPIGVTGILGAASGERVDVILSGVAEVEYGGTITRGALITADANGKAVAASAGNQIIGRAMVSGVSGDIGSVLLQPVAFVNSEQDVVVDVTVATAAVKTLNATPVELVAAPGANKFVEVTGLTFFLDYASAAYDGIAAGEDLNVRYTDGSGQLIATCEATGFMDATADAVRHCTVGGATVITPVANAAVVLYMATGEIATGDSPLKVRVSYKIKDAVL